jgi:magnesium chelatase family protein
MPAWRPAASAPAHGHGVRAHLRLNSPGTSAARSLHCPQTMAAYVSAVATICGKPLGLARATGSALMGLDYHPICVEVCCTRGPSFFQLVGLAEAAVREARVRVASALARLGVLLDEYAITVNLAPAELRKSGAALDVAMAVGVLGAIGKLPQDSLEDTLLLGELSLSGEIQPVRGVLPQLEGARSRGTRTAIVPASNAAEAGLVEGIQIHVADRLDDIVAHLRGERKLRTTERTVFAPSAPWSHFDMQDVRGQSTARRALEIAAAGGHNLLFIGPPGSGKTMLARLLPAILPPLRFEEAIEVTAIHSVAGLVDAHKGIVSARPFRAPHHSVSEPGLVGGGETPRPGEVSLAHGGVLFLDEIAEFKRSALEALRQPLEDGYVCIARARARAMFPARPVVVGAANPCPCGYRGHPTRGCRCSDASRQRYRERLSGPLVDRLDVHAAVPPVEIAQLTSPARGESTAAVRERVAVARNAQLARRDTGETAVAVNAQLGPSEIQRVAALDADGRRLIDAAANQIGLSARGFLKVLRVARTIADLEGSQRVRAPHVAEAIQGRLLDRQGMP